MESEGIILNDPKPMPVDPYSKRRENPPPCFTTPSELKQRQQFLTMDRKVKDIPSIPNSEGVENPDPDICLQRSRSQYHV